ncbi:hypothetical protein S245_013179, partial [Arachis hypogaea]
SFGLDLSLKLDSKDCLETSKDDLNIEQEFYMWKEKAKEKEMINEEQKVKLNDAEHNLSIPAEDELGTGFSDDEDDNTRYMKRTNHNLNKLQLQTTTTRVYGILFFHMEDGIPPTDKSSDFLWAKGLESTPTPICVLPRVGLGNKGAHLGLDGVTVGVGSSDWPSKDFTGWRIQQDFGDVDPPATMENASLAQAIPNETEKRKNDDDSLMSPSPDFFISLS